MDMKHVVVTNKLFHVESILTLSQYVCIPCRITKIEYPCVEFKNCSCSFVDSRGLHPYSNECS